MNQHEFNHYMVAILNGMENKVGEDATGSTMKQHSRWAYKECVKLFKDYDGNIKRWLNGRPCIIRNNDTQRIIEVEIGNDLEALYYFLIFCFKRNNHQKINDDFLNYLAYIISRSTNKSWDEC